MYRSAGYEQLADYLKKQVRPHLIGYLQSMRGTKEDEKLLCVLCEEAIVGTLMRWVCDPRRTTDPIEINQATDRIKSYFTSALRKIANNYQIEGGEEI